MVMWQVGKSDINECSDGCQFTRGWQYESTLSLWCVVLVIVVIIIMFSQAL